MKELWEEISQKISIDISNSIKGIKWGAPKPKRRRIELKNIVMRYVLCVVKQLFLRIYIYSNEV